MELGDRPWYDICRAQGIWLSGDCGQQHTLCLAGSKGRSSLYKKSSLCPLPGLQALVSVLLQVEHPPCYSSSQLLHSPGPLRKYQLLVSLQKTTETEGNNSSMAESSERAQQGSTSNSMDTYWKSLDLILRIVIALYCSLERFSRHFKVLWKVS